MAMITKYIKAWFGLASWKQIIIGLVAGIVTGLLLGDRAAFLEPIGTMFIHAIQMLVVPVVVTAIVCAVTSITDLGRMGKIVGKTLVVYALCMAVSATLGIFIANLFSVGLGFSLPHEAISAAAHKTLSISDILVSLIPTSPVQAFATNNVMQILCFSVFFGIAIKLVGEKAKPVKDLFQSLSLVVFRFAKIIIGFAPYGIFALIACVFGRYGIGAMLPLLKFVGAVYLSCAILVFIVFTSALFIYRIKPIYFFRGVSDAIITAFTTSSSAATLPVTMRCARENLKINRDLSDVLLPLGTTLNLNGLSIYLSVATIFAANIFGISLNLTQYFSLVIMIVLTAAGAAAIPGSALIVMSAVMSSVGVPLGALPLIAGVDRFNDMAQTATNVAGDLFAATIIAKNEGMIDEASLEETNETIGLESNDPVA